MKISHEVPIDLLGISHSFNDYCYCLVHLLPQYEQYREHYFNAVKSGRHVLLDNSIFELGEAYDSKEFASWVKRLTPTEYIVPDVLECANETKEKFLEFTQTHNNLPGKIIAVVQGKNYQEIKELYQFFSSHEKVNKIAISFDYSYYLTDDCKRYSSNLNYTAKDTKWLNYSLGRASTIQRLEEDGVLVKNKKLHLLGCSLPFEFSLYRFLELDQYIDTIDTSNPIVAGILHKKYEEDGIHEKWPCKLVDYIDTRLTPEQIKTIWYNVNMFRKLFVK